jgi:ATP-dependent Lon protease
MNAEDVLIILPVSNAVLFPGVVLPIAIDGNAALAAAQEAVRTQQPKHRAPRICIASARPPASCVSSPRRTVPTI